MGVAEALAAIDAANAHDPNSVDVDGVERPKELLHAERMTWWLDRLDPNADDAQRLAARAHHFRRWTWPRSAYPEGRAGYLKWRRLARAGQAAEVKALLLECGVDERVADDAAHLVNKDGLGSDPRSQTHEDALCLVFFELQGLETAATLGAKAPNVVAKTLAKMSPVARDHLVGLDLNDGLLEVIRSQM